MGVREERTISMEKLRIVLTSTGLNWEESPAGRSHNLRGTNHLSRNQLLFSSRIYWLTLPQGGHSGRGKAEGKTALSLEGCLLPFSSRSPLTPSTQTSHPHVYTPTTCPWLCLLSPHSPRLRSPSFRCPLCHSSPSVFSAPQSLLASEQANVSQT